MLQIMKRSSLGRLHKGEDCKNLKVIALKLFLLFIDFSAFIYVDILTKLVWGVYHLPDLKGRNRKHFRNVFFSEKVHLIL